MYNSEKRCRICKEVKSRSEFREHVGVNDGISSTCRSCLEELHRPTTKLDRYLRRVYGITSEDFITMADDQEYVCAICGLTPRSGRLHVDHDHETGAVRGLLCPNCNSMLGHGKDNIDTLHTAIDYLQRNLEAEVA